MSAKHHNYLRSERELTFEAQGLRLGSKTEESPLTWGHHSCSAEAARTQALERASCPAPPGAAGDSRVPTPKCCYPSSWDEGRKSHRAEVQPLPAAPGPERSGSAASSEQHQAAEGAAPNRPLHWTELMLNTALQTRA